MPGHQRARLEGGLLDLREEVLRVAVQRHRADLDQRVVAVRPDLGEVERVDPVGLRVVVRHRLDRQRPAREVTLGDRVVEVAAVEVGVLAGDLGGVLVLEALDALVAVEVVLDPVLLAGLVDPEVGVRAVAVHVAVGLRDAAVAHQVGDLVRRLRVEAPEVPLHVVVAQAVAAATLLRADEVRELHGVADEEDRGVVADEVVVALVGVELQREATRVAPGVGGALLAGHGGEAGQHLGLHARLEQPGLGVRRDVLGRLELTEGTRALGVHVALGDALPVEVRHLVQEVHVVEQDRPVGTDRQAVAVARRGGAGVGRRADGGLGRRSRRDGSAVVRLGQVCHGSLLVSRRAGPGRAHRARTHGPSTQPPRLE